MPFPGMETSQEVLIYRKASPSCQLKSITISRNKGVGWISSLSGHGMCLCHCSTQLCHSSSHFCHFSVVCSRVLSRLLG